MTCYLEDCDFYRNNTKLKRMHLSQSIIRKNGPEAIPVIIFCQKNDNIVLERKKFIVQAAQSVGKLLQSTTAFIIDKKPNFTYQFLSNNKIVDSTQSLSELYFSEKNEDGFLYLRLVGYNHELMLYHANWWAYWYSIYYPAYDQLATTFTGTIQMIKAGTQRLYENIVYYWPSNKVPETASSSPECNQNSVS